MNKKVQKLADQCWSHYINGVLIDGHLHFDYNKFAELIVRECASFADKHNQQKLYEDYTLGVGKAIKKHFGVEE